MLPNPHAVGVPPNDSVRVFERLIVLWIFRTNEDVVGLFESCIIKSGGCFVSRACTAFDEMRCIDEVALCEEKYRLAGRAMGELRDLAGRTFPSTCMMILWMVTPCGSTYSFMSQESGSSIIILCSFVVDSSIVPSRKVTAPSIMSSPTKVQ